MPSTIRPNVSPCGTEAHYQAGCREPACRQAHAEYRQRRRKKHVHATPEWNAA